MTELERRTIYANIDKRRIQDLEAENRKLKEIIKALMEQSKERENGRNENGKSF